MHAKLTEFLYPKMESATCLAFIMGRELGSLCIQRARICFFFLADMLRLSILKMTASPKVLQVIDGNG